MKCKLRFALLCFCLCIVLSCLCFALKYATLVSSECTRDFFDCKNGKCIGNYFQCDGHNDCGNFEDELYCLRTTIKSFIEHFYEAERCRWDFFDCKDRFGTCLSKRFICNGMKDCANGADEENCSKFDIFKIGCYEGFKCDNFQCIPKVWHCDGFSDCGDNSDETNCTLFKKTERCEKEYGKFECSSGECIPYSKVCDSHNDCLHGDDESHVVCHVDSSHVKECLPGYQLLNDTCHDFDECADNRLTNLCSQRCINLEGSYRCDCFDQYQLVNSTCQVKGESPILYFSTGNEIRALDLRTQLYYRVVETTSEAIVGMDMIVDQQKLFYVSLNIYGSLSRVSIAGGKQPKTGVELLFHEDIVGIKGISVDWLGNNFYVTDSHYKRIMVCNIDLVYCATLLENLDYVRGFVVVPSKGRLFWTQNHAGIYQAGMDGRDRSQLFDLVSNPDSLALDEEMDRLYWCTDSGSIEYYDFKLKVRRLVYKDFNRQPYALSVFEDNLYWSDMATNQIVVCNKITGHYAKPLVVYHDNPIFALYVYHPQQKSARMRLHNPCDANPCSHLCLLQTNATSFTCHCPDHMVLSSNGHKCINKMDQPFVLVSTGQKVFKNYIHSVTSDSFEEMPILPIYQITEIAFNFDREELYIHDLNKNRIGLLDLVYIQWKTLVDVHLDQVKNLIYDANTDNLYWVDTSKGTLEAASTLGKGRAILNNQLIKPISLAISPQNRKFYVGQCTNPSEIVMLDMDGKSKQTLMISLSGFPLAIATYRDYIFWSDSNRQKIEFIKTQNGHPVDQSRELIDSNVGTISSMAVDNQRIYWTKSNSSALYFCSTPGVLRFGYLKLLFKNNFNVEDLKVTVGTKQKVEYDFCLAGHKCAHLCLIGYSGATCKCADGFSTTDDGVTCIKSVPAKIEIKHNDYFNIWFLFCILLGFIWFCIFGLFKFVQAMYNKITGRFNRDPNYGLESVVEINNSKDRK